MSHQAGWDVLPDAVISRVLWSRDLHLVDRLRCREVCKTWERLLQERPCGLQRKGLSHDLCIEFSGPYTVPLFPYDHLPTIVLGPLGVLSDCLNGASDDAAPSVEEWCFRWLMPRAHLIRRVGLSGKIGHGGLLEVIRALQVAAPQTPPVIDIISPTGTTQMATVSLHSVKAPFLDSFDLVVAAWLLQAQYCCHKTKPCWPLRLLFWMSKLLNRRSRCKMLPNDWPNHPSA